LPVFKDGKFDAEDEMGRACSTNGRDKKFIYIYIYIGGKARRKETTKKTKT
jgi:hypothetical protein